MRLEHVAKTDLLEKKERRKLRVRPTRRRGRWLVRRLVHERSPKKVRGRCDARRDEV